jgi:hypothetical protein
MNIGILLTLALAFAFASIHKWVNVFEVFGYEVWNKMHWIAMDDGLRSTGFFVILIAGSVLTITLSRKTIKG